MRVKLVQFYLQWMFVNVATHAGVQNMFLQFCGICFMQELTSIKEEEDRELDRLRQKELFLKYQLESLV